MRKILPVLLGVGCLLFSQTPLDLRIYPNGDVDLGQGQITAKGLILNGTGPTVWNFKQGACPVALTPGFEALICNEGGIFFGLSALGKTQLDNLTPQQSGNPIYEFGLTIENSGGVLTPGIGGRKQLAVPGTIIGWSAIAEQVGDVSIEISKKASSVPPAAPQIPDVVTDKITASAPIRIIAARTAAGDASSVATWNKSIAAWDVVTFNIVSASGITKVQIQVRYQ